LVLPTFYGRRTVCVKNLYAFAEIGDEQAIVADRPDHYRFSRVKNRRRFMEHFGLRLVEREEQFVLTVCCIEYTKLLTDEEITPRYNI